MAQRAFSCSLGRLPPIAAICFRPHCATRTRAPYRALAPSPRTPISSLATPSAYDSPQRQIADRCPPPWSTPCKTSLRALARPLPPHGHLSAHDSSPGRRMRPGERFHALWVVRCRPQASALVHATEHELARPPTPSHCTPTSPFSRSLGRPLPSDLVLATSTAFDLAPPPPHSILSYQKTKYYSQCNKYIFDTCTFAEVLLPDNSRTTVCTYFHSLCLPNHSLDLPNHSLDLPNHSLDLPDHSVNTVCAAGLCIYAAVLT